MLIENLNHLRRALSFAPVLCSGWLTATAETNLYVAEGTVSDDNQPGMFTVNWLADTPRDAVGSWRVSHSQFRGFTLQSMINGVEAGELSWANANNVVLGVSGDDSYGFAAAINSTHASGVIREAIRIHLPAKDGPVGPAQNARFKGLTAMALSRLQQHGGSIIAIEGFKEDPQAYWRMEPGPAKIVYEAEEGRLVVDTRTASQMLGVIGFANPDATLGPDPVALTISNDYFKDNLGAFGLVGWSYLSEPVFEKALEFAGLSTESGDGPWLPLQAIGPVHAAYFPWIHSASQGWLYASNGTWEDGVWFYDPRRLEWLATGADAYPWVYLRGRGWLPVSDVPYPDKVRFEDRTEAFGLPSNLGGLGARVCWVDFNNNGWVDLIAGSRIFINQNGTRFNRLAGVAGLGAVIAADINNNGYPDLFSITNLKLHRNNGGASLSELALPAFPEGYISQGAAFGDFTGNGLVDIYVGGYEVWDDGITFPDFLLVNQGDETFVIGWTNDRRRGRGVTACDFNRDGALDVYVSNYRLQPNFLWRNDGQGNFEDVAAEKNVLGTSPGFNGGHTIGSAWGDFDNSGDFDLVIANLAHVDHRGDQPKSRFLRNMGAEHGFRFEDMGESGIFYQESYASPAAGDFNNNGRLDVVITTVYAPAAFGVMNYPVLFQNDGHFRFRDVTDSAGLSELPPTYQAAWADINNNGHLDLFIVGRLFLNQGSRGNWLKVRLNGDGVNVNRSAVGAQVRIRIAPETLSRQVEAGTGQGNQNERTLHFGLGWHGDPVDLEIFWPDGRYQTIEHVPLNQLLTVDYAP